MANRYAIASGNWDNPAIWDGGITVPQSGDDVRPNGFTVTINTDVTVTTLRNDALAPSAAGGKFVCNRNGTIINANLVIGAPSVNLLDNTTTAISWTVNGNITHGSFNNATGIFMTPASTLNFTGNATGSFSSGASYAYGINGASATVNAIGNMTGGSNQPSGSNSYAINCFTLNLTGNSTGGSGACGGVVATNLTMVGNAYGAGFINNTAFGAGGTNVNFTGIAYGASSGLGGPGLSCTNLTGTCTGIGGTGYFGISIGGIANTAVITAQGCPTVGGSVGVFGGNSSNVVISSAVYTRCAPIGGKVRFKNVNPTITVLKQNTTNTTLVEAGASGDYPLQSNVRSGITYASSTLTGTLAMAAPSDVRVNVPTDNTVGTATITAQDFWDYAVSNLTTNNSIGKRLKNCSTVDTTGDQLTALSN